MAEKLAQKTWPNGHGQNDFKCFGPPATEDGNFEGTMIGDLGYFNQQMADEMDAGDEEPKGRDSNKFYHGAVVQSTTTNDWYAYFEWGRQGAGSASFQFIACSSKEEAQREYAKQMHSKNDKRGQWITHPRLGKVLRPKPGKDCYLVRPQATRSTGLPDAKTVVMAEEVKVTQKPKKGKKKVVSVDPQTMSLLRDIQVATTDYTRSSMADSCIPTKGAIEEARSILDEATMRIGSVGNSVDDQLADSELRDLTNHLYGRIPKRKERGAPPASWLLTQDNILVWRQDLDAFESALASQELEVEIDEDPYGGMPIEMEWVDPKTEVGKFIHEWMPPARGRHHYGPLKIRNVWAVKRGPDATRFEKKLEEVAKARPKIDAADRAKFQPKKRPDVDHKTALKYARTQTCMLFHGTRSVNVSGILRTSFRLPNQLKGVVITGAMFGPGVYYASMWTKSAGYTSVGSSYYAGGGGGIRGRGAFMFINDVILGKPHVAPDAHGYTSAPNGCHSVYGKSGQTRSWGGTLQNDEHIIYDVSQHNMRYLVEFEA